MKSLNEEDNKKATERVLVREQYFSEYTTVLLVSDNLLTVLKL
jgi:hypothetical protein